ncbi:hypothetical protein UFOVP244_20 [uncultured Caudovirales phage]|uniref:Uncharacterized protein n=1 Tax=uncultured Caudovirales phage TaxID=2100421 RepID=A0A6J7WVG3_9CAUD|nr:hypothetical protein UFOVP244_20 [uncultured Caudovirales phage]
MTSDDQTYALDTSSIQPKDFGIGRTWSIEVNPTGSISILGLNKCAHELGIPKSTKRIMKKRVKKKIIEILERTLLGY